MTLRHCVVDVDVAALQVDHTQSSHRCLHVPVELIESKSQLMQTDPRDAASHPIALRAVHKAVRCV